MSGLREEDPGSPVRDLVGWAAVCSVVVVPCLILPLRDRFVVPKLAAAGVTALAAAAALIRARSLGKARSRVDIPVLAFCAAALASSLGSIDPWLSWFGSVKVYVFGMPGIAACVGAFYVGCAARGSAPAVLRWAAAGSLPVSAFAVVQWMGWDPVLGALTDRPVSTIGNPSALGAYLAAVLPLALHAGRGGGILGACAASLALVALGLTGSRGAYLAGASGLGVYWVLEARAGRGRGIVPRRPLIAGAVLLFLVFAGGHLLWRSSHLSRDSDVPRLKAWRTAATVFSEQPWLGSGPDTFLPAFRMRKDESLAGYNYGDAHNDWLTILATMGLAGAAVFAWLHVAAFLGLLAAMRREPEMPWSAMAAAIAAVLVHVKFNVPCLAAVWLAALFAGCVLGKADPGGPGPAGKEERVSVPGAPGWTALRDVRPGPVLLIFAAAWASFAGARAVVADRQVKLGLQARADWRPEEAAARFERAVALRPEETLYRYDFANFLWHAASGAKTLEQRRAILARAAGVALQGARLRPMDSDAHRLLGVAELRRAQAGEDRLLAARTALGSALRLDPFSRDALRASVEEAVVRGDRAAADRHRRALLRISAGRKVDDGR